ncbi:MAG TPA: Gfo/Idh/MocA family oxidoreductase [Pirellulales bacterium]
MKPVNVAVVGVGHLGRIHARIISGLPEFHLVGLVDPVPENLSQATNDFHAPGFRDPRELPDGIDAAIIATPTRFHHQVATELMARGMHLLIEKPLASTYPEACELVDLSHEQGVVLQVGHVERFNPAFGAALPHLTAPKYVTAVRRSGFSFRSTDIGVVLDLMIHDIDLVLSLVRSPLRNVEALGLSLFGRHEDVANARLAFENGCIAELSASRASRLPARTMDIWSSRAMASLDFTSRTVALVRPSEAIVRREVDIERMSPADRTALKDRLLVDHLPIEQMTIEPRDAITAELKDFAESITTGRAPQVTGEAGRDAVDVAERILAKMARHAWDGTPDGPVGPHVAPTRQIIPGPHWGRKPATSPIERREAG